MVFDEKDGICIERISESVYLVRGYAPGGFYPQPYIGVGTVVVDGPVARYVGWLFKDGARFRPEQAKFVHYFFRMKGCTERIYDRVSKLQFRQIRKEN